MVLGMIVMTPLGALIEWHDNGRFERWSSSSEPGGWDPRILPAGGVWALALAVLAFWGVPRPATNGAVRPRASAWMHRGGGFTGYGP
jgi:hypothetical protein